MGAWYERGTECGYVILTSGGLEKNPTGGWSSAQTAWKEVIDLEKDQRRQGSAVDLSLVSETRASKKKAKLGAGRSGKRRACKDKRARGGEMSCLGRV